MRELEGRLPRRRLIVMLVSLGLLAAAALFLVNLGDQALWQDEGMTAAVSRTILGGGLPLGFDGRNHFSQELGHEYGPDHVWRWQAWLPYYLLAAFFRLFGTSTFVARLPGALAGLATVPSTYLLARRLFKDRAVGWAAAALLAVNVPFLLLSRQCRYYSLAALFAVWCLLAYLALERKARWAGAALVAAATLLFHVQYVYVGTLYLTLLIHAHTRQRALVRPVLVSGVVTALINAPFIVWFAGMKYWSSYGGSLLMLRTPLLHAGTFLVQLVARTWPPLFLIALAVALYTAAGEQPGKARDRWAWALCWQFFAVHLVVLSLASPAAFFRYLAPLLPVGCVALGLLAVKVLRWRPWFGAVLAGGLVLGAGAPLPSFLHELTHHYRGPIDGILDYLRTEARPGQMVAITYGDLPLKFYRPDLRILGGLTGEDLGPARQADFVIIRQHVVCSKDQAVRDWLLANIDWPRYQKVELDAPDARFQNRESLPEHRFRTATDEPPVVVYRRVR